MRLSKSMLSHIAFARFAKARNIDPADVAELLTLASRAFAAAERECNTGRSADPARRRFEAKARSLGFGVEWNGLGPTLTKGGYDVYLPSV